VTRLQAVDPGAPVPLHVVRLQFEAGGPAVTGEWAEDATARRTWRDWVGLYGSDEKVVIRLAEQSGGSERVLLAWERGRVAETRADGSHRSGS
jgi:hypothetical protein